MGLRVAALEGYPGRWWLCGGWAIDLFVGRAARAHEDVDVAVVRDEQGLVREHLAGWDLHWVPTPGVLEPWDGSHIELPRHEIWARRDPDAPWEVELLLNEVRDNVWTYRRDARVRRPAGEIGVVRDGVPLLAPEIVLLYKAKQPRELDERDFAHALPALDRRARRWLAGALAVAHPGHHWLEHLA